MIGENILIHKPVIPAYLKKELVITVPEQLQKFRMLGLGGINLVKIGTVIKDYTHNIGNK